MVLPNSNVFKRFSNNCRQLRPLLDCSNNCRPRSDCLGLVSIAEEESDKGLHCLPFLWHVLVGCIINYSNFRLITVIFQVYQFFFFFFDCVQLGQSASVTCWLYYPCSQQCLRFSDFINFQLNILMNIDVINTFASLMHKQ